MLTRQELREFVHTRWGRDLETASAADLRDGLAELQAMSSPVPEDGVWVLDDLESATDYHTAMKQFFGRVLQGDADAGLVQLWITALELWLALDTRDKRPRT